MLISFISASKPPPPLSKPLTNLLIYSSITPQPSSSTSPISTTITPLTYASTPSDYLFANFNHFFHDLQVVSTC